MYELSTTVTVLNRIYTVRNQGDYRTILQVIKAINDPDLTYSEKYSAAIILFYNNINCVEDVFNEFETNELLNEAIRQIMVFINCGTDFNTSVPPIKLINWETDEKLIVSAINPMLGNGQDIRFIKYVHWWTFISYYLGIQESALATVVNIRNKIVKHKKLEKYEVEFRQNNPEFFNWCVSDKTKDEQDFENYIMDIWGNKIQGGD